jgi:hypothetical protein
MPAVAPGIQTPDGHNTAPTHPKIISSSENTQADHDAGTVAGADLGAVLIPVQVADPVQPALD